MISATAALIGVSWNGRLAWGGGPVQVVQPALARAQTLVVGPLQPWRWHEAVACQAPAFPSCGGLPVDRRTGRNGSSDAGGSVSATDPPPTPTRPPRPVDPRRPEARGEGGAGSSAGRSRRAGEAAAG